MVEVYKGLLNFLFTFVDPILGNKQALAIQVDYYLLLLQHPSGMFCGFRFQT